MESLQAIWLEARILSWQPGFDSHQGKTAEKDRQNTFKELYSQGML